MAPDTPPARTATVWAWLLSHNYVIDLSCRVDSKANIFQWFDEEFHDVEQDSTTTDLSARLVKFLCPSSLQSGLRLLTTTPTHIFDKPDEILTFSPLIQMQSNE